MADLPRKLWSLEEESRGEREEKKNLNAKREEEREENFKRVSDELRIAVRYELGFRRWRSGCRSMRKTMRWVCEKSMVSTIAVSNRQ